MFEKQNLFLLHVYALLLASFSHILQPQYMAAMNVVMFVLNT